eukprot:m.473503 g.473503  ORF g.473503 m.473503 type:complete len:300 (+) comp57127_c0_seq1:437-1336(+)
MAQAFALHLTCFPTPKAEIAVPKLVSSLRGFQENATANLPARMPKSLPVSHLSDMSRDSRARKECHLGILQLHIYTNGNVDRGAGIPAPPSLQDLEYLTSIKNLFAGALPNMPKDYLTRLVFDASHKSLALLKDHKVVGAICFRPFPGKSFLEIVFCAIASCEQVKGYGTFLMNQLKAYALANDCSHLLTYADNMAIGYFKKQGFSKDITLAKSDYQGFIKDYDGGTMMHCRLHTFIQYLDIPGMAHRQKLQVMEETSAKQGRGTVYEGLKVFDEGRSFIPIEEIPGVREAGWTADATD